jgi:TusE/DsrC/DsvC family sulfur relay protein
MDSTSHYVELDGSRYLLSEQNYLLDLECWDERIRDYIAGKLQLSLGEDHKTVIELIRSSYSTRNKHPFVRIVTADMARVMGEEKGSRRYFYSLFPKGIHQAFQLAGLPMQGFCF